VKLRPKLPGLKKASPSPLIRRRSVELWASSDYTIRQMFEQADVMSEGAPRREASRTMYYGTTSIVLLTQSRGGHVPDQALLDSVRLLRADPHARLRALRIAWREASVRARAPLGQLRAELSFSATTTGVKIDVDVEAEQLEQSVRSRSTG
jgi:hypothetical protein